MLFTANKYTVNEWVNNIYQGYIEPEDIEPESLNTIYIGCLKERFHEEISGLNKMDYCPKLTMTINKLERYIINRLSN
ncbi:hypothetical protein TROLL_273 [Bacillus phage Troll]|uniref:Uncharacterized protein n=1 Tax=Bacillus phage Troll TaxID=1382932 RepID=S5YCX9_9CAUD|nr:hypothetical protein TROLL_273 [Bacillus phage Troll]AGT13620.1 hypothetical protein TROLL_273 [Bacillus phage Troll]